MTRISNKPKSKQLSIVLLLMLSLSALVVVPQKAAAQTDGYYEKCFAWDYNGQHWSWNLTIPVALYDAYKAVPISTRTRDGPAGYGFCTTTNDLYVQSLAKQLNDTANQLGYNDFDKVSFVLSFVQSLPYTSDSVTTGHDEYPRFPIETLVDDGGDCEDTSILFATLTLIMNYGTVYINPPNHYAVGILGNNLRGTYWTYPSNSSNTYYYCETTGNSFMIGQLPENFKGQTASIYPINQNKQFIPQIDLATPKPNPTTSTITSPTTTKHPTQATTTPSIQQPNAQSVMPTITIGVITENPLLYILIVFTVVVSVGLFVISKRQPAPSIPS
jgi:hypothetical protein